MNKDLEAMLDKYEIASDIMISNIIGLPLLAHRIAQNAMIIKNEQNIKTEQQWNGFLIADLTDYSKSLKGENCLGYIFIDKYIETLKAT